MLTSFSSEYKPAASKAPSSVRSQRKFRERPIDLRSSPKAMSNLQLCYRQQVISVVRYKTAQEIASKSNQKEDNHGDLEERSESSMYIVSSTLTSAETLLTLFRLDVSGCWYCLICSIRPPEFDQVLCLLTDETGMRIPAVSNHVIS